MLISGCWQGIQVEISNSQLEMTLYMTDCWSRLQKWKLKSFSEKFKLWFDRNHTVSKSENTQKHSGVEDRPQGGRERSTWRRRSGIRSAFSWPVTGQAAQVGIYVSGPLLESSWIYDFFFSAWQNLFPLLPYFFLAWKCLHGERQRAEGGPGCRFFHSTVFERQEVGNRLAGKVLRLWLPFLICAAELTARLKEAEGMCVRHLCLEFTPLAL